MEHFYNKIKILGVDLIKEHFKKSRTQKKLCNETQKNNYLFYILNWFFFWYTAKKEKKVIDSFANSVFFCI